LGFSLQSIDAKDLAISELFNDFYVVPSYQREYVWETPHVEQLLADIHYKFTNNLTSDSSEYFIGSIVVLAGTTQTYEIIDGQQRMTTLFIAFCAIRDYLKGQDQQPPIPLQNNIASFSMNSDGEQLFRYRVSLQYEDSRGILDNMGAGNSDLTQFPSDTRSVANILNAYNVTLKFLKDELRNDGPHAVLKFFAFLTNNVKLIRIKTTSIADALKLFETINDRGVRLTSMDLLKNLLFMHAKQKDFEALKDTWKDLIDTLFKAKENPLRFLRYYNFASYNVERLEEDGIYRWLLENEVQVGYKSNPMGFAYQLLAAAQAYTYFLKGKNVDGSPNRFLDNIRYLSGAARQHLILLLAGRHLPKDAFELLSQQLENLFFAYIITHELTRKFEGTFARWSTELRKTRNSFELKSFIAERFEPAKKDLVARFQLAFQELNEDSLQQYRLRYILAKISQHVDEVAELPPSKELKNYINNKIDIEHILPQTPSKTVFESFDKPDEYTKYMHLLGNLTLLEKDIDAAIRNGPFIEKQGPYTMSIILLTKSLGTQIQVGQNAAHDRAARLLECFDSWTSKDVERRQRMLGRLAEKVWMLDSQKT
jgi:hypothetical protein